ncbi:MAG TPA: carbon starvation protein A, partial [Tissierellaceae bacterium]
KAHWMASIPATFMTAVSATYILQAPEGFKLSTSIAYPVGAVVAIGAIAFFLVKANAMKKAVKA